MIFYALRHGRPVTDAQCAPLRGALQCSTAPVGADAHIRPSAFGRLRGRVDEGIDPYGDTGGVPYFVPEVERRVTSW